MRGRWRYDRFKLDEPPLPQAKIRPPTEIYLQFASDPGKGGMAVLFLPLLQKTAKFRAICLPLAWLAAPCYGHGSESDLYLLSFSGSSPQNRELDQGHMVSNRNREFIFKRSNALLGVEMVNQ